MTTINTSTRNRVAATLATVLTLPLVAHGAGTIIVQDNFDRNGALVGSNANTGQTWGGTSAYSTFSPPDFYQVDGDTTSFATISGLTFLTNSTYCLAVDMQIFLPISNGYTAVGFKETGATSYASGTVGTFQLEESAQVVSHPANLTLPQIDLVSGTDHRLEVRLTTGATLASSSLEWRVDGTVERTGVAIDASSVDGIYLAHGSTDNQFRARFERLELLGPIPEPSSLALLALGGLGLLIRRSR